MNTKIIQNTENFVKDILKNAEGGHDWWHIKRVVENTESILKSEKADFLICRLGALLHDIADHKFHDKGSEYGPEIAAVFLTGQHFPEKDIVRVTDIIRHISFSTELKGKQEKSIELQIVQDADRLDAMGAIGIARAFNYGGYKNRPIHDPGRKPIRTGSAEEYLGSDAPTINHFYEKLLLLKDRMNTKTGLKLAAQRHEFMLEYLRRFFDEWEGKK
jgi:uncharacterized protein